jgi:hypothetical protein
MKLPVFIKIILNIIFYVIYVLFITILTSFILPLVFDIFIENGSKISSIIQFVIAVVILFITTVYRKYFYISLGLEIKKISKENVQIVEEDTIISSNDELDILVAKEK